MRDFTISTGTATAKSAFTTGATVASTVAVDPTAQTLLLPGGDRIATAALAAWALAEERPLILSPFSTPEPHTMTSAATHTAVLRSGIDPTGRPSAAGLGWDIAFYTSGSTGTPRGYGFTTSQLDTVAAWYTDIYQATSDSVIITHLPPGYNFTFVAGLYLAATLGAHLHLTTSPDEVFPAARSLAKRHDRCTILANPVLLQRPPAEALPDNCLIDTGGAPLSTTAINYYRAHVADLREGYGLTETCSLTHFDRAGSTESLGTVGAGMPTVDTSLTIIDGKPRIVIATPARGFAMDGDHVPAQGPLVTGDVGHIDGSGQLRLLGRQDDYGIAGLWPRDVLDIIGDILGTRTALVRHPTHDRVHIRLTDLIAPDRIISLRTTVADATHLPAAAVTVDTADTLLHSFKVPRPVPVDTAVARSSEETR